MDPDDVSRLVEELKLTADAGEAVVTIKEDELRKGAIGNGMRLEKFVVGKIFATRVVNREALKFQLPKILQTRGMTDIEIVGDNLFVVVFANDRDRQHALVDGPWHFFDNLMIFKEPKGMEKATDVEFDTFTTWIQCHNLPLICMNPGMIRKIAEHVGQVEEIDVGDGGNCLGQYARARVSRDVNKPLQRCVSITTGEAKENHIILIRYERLPEYCSACGRVGHGVRHCTDLSADKQKRPFGVWLKANRTLENRRGRGDSQRRLGLREREETINSDTRDQTTSDVQTRVLVVRKDKGGDKEATAGEDIGQEEGGTDRGSEGVEEDVCSSMEVGETDGDKQRVVVEETGMLILNQEEEVGGGGSKGDDRQLMKMKKRGKGKEWKRLAREVKGNNTEVMMEGGGIMVRETGKRKGDLEIDPEILVPKLKISRVEGVFCSNDGPTAEAASQPRRPQ